MYLQLLTKVFYGFMQSSVGLVIKPASVLSWLHILTTGHDLNLKKAKCWELEAEETGELDNGIPSSDVLWEALRHSK